MHDPKRARECLGLGFDARKVFAKSAIGCLMPPQNRFGAADREWAERMVTF